MARFLVSSSISSSLCSAAALTISVRAASCSISACVGGLSSVCRRGRGLGRCASIACCISRSSLICCTTARFDLRSSPVSSTSVFGARCL